MKQKLMRENTLDWNKIYINIPKDKVIIFKDKQCNIVSKVITFTKFKKLMKKVPNINFLVCTFI